MFLSRRFLGRLLALSGRSCSLFACFGRSFLLLAVRLGLGGSGLARLGVAEAVELLELGVVAVLLLIVLRLGDRGPQHALFRGLFLLDGLLIAGLLVLLGLAALLLQLDHRYAKARSFLLELVHIVRVGAFSVFLLLKLFRVGVLAHFS